MTDKNAAFPLHRKAALLGTLALAAALALAGCGKKGGEPQAQAPQDEWGTITIGANDPIKLGVATALSGDVAPLGLPIRDAAVLAVEEKGQILGHRVEANVQDDGCAPEPSTNAARTLTADPLVAGVVGSMCSSGSIPASEVYDEAKLTMVSPSTTAPNFTTRGLQITFRTAWNDRIQGAAQAKFARDTLKAGTAVLLHDQSPYGQGLMEAFKENFEAAGGKVALLEGIAKGATDYSAVVSKVKPLNPDVVAFGGFIREGALLVKQLRDAGVKAIFMGADGIDSAEFVTSAGGKAEGVYISNGQAMKGAAFDAFNKKWHDKYGADAPVFTAQTYDAAVILLNAIEKVAVKNADGSLTIGKKALRDAVLATEMDGASGPIAFDAAGDRKVAAEAVIKQVKNGKIETVTTIAP